MLYQSVNMWHPHFSLSDLLPAYPLVFRAFVCARNKITGLKVCGDFRCVPNHYCARHVPLKCLDGRGHNLHFVELQRCSRPQSEQSSVGRMMRPSGSKGYKRVRIPACLFCISSSLSQRQINRMANSFDVFVARLIEHAKATSPSQRRQSSATIPM